MANDAQTPKPDRFVSMDDESLDKYAGPTKEAFRQELLRADEALQKSHTFTPRMPAEPKKRIRRQ